MVTDVPCEVSVKKSITVTNGEEKITPNPSSTPWVDLVAPPVYNSRLQLWWKLLMMHQLAWGGWLFWNLASWWWKEHMVVEGGRADWWRWKVLVQARPPTSYNCGRSDVGLKNWEEMGWWLGGCEKEGRARNVNRVVDWKGEELPNCHSYACMMCLHDACWVLLGEDMNGWKCGCDVKLWSTTV